MGATSVNEFSKLDTTTDTFVCGSAKTVLKLCHDHSQTRLRKEEG